MKSKKSIGKKIALERGTFRTPQKQSAKKTEIVQEKISASDEKLVDKFVSENKKKGLRIFVAGGSRSGHAEHYVEEAYKLGLKIGEMGFKLDFGLSSQGIMGAVAKGVLDAFAKKGGMRGEASPINAITTDMYLSFYENDDILTKLGNIVVARTLEERKRMLLDADFIVFAPGGIGTLDELVYDCVAMQDGMLPAKPFILFNVDGFFYHILEFLKYINVKGFADRMPFIVVDNIDEAEIVFEMLKDEHIKDMKMSALYSKVRDVIYMLPHLVHEKKIHPAAKARKLINQTKATLAGEDEQALHMLRTAIEREYLKKETERMYQRLSYSARDVTIQGDKLNKLIGRITDQRKLDSNPDF